MTNRHSTPDSLRPCCNAAFICPMLPSCALGFRGRSARPSPWKPASYTPIRSYCHQRIFTRHSRPAPHHPNRQQPQSFPPSQERHRTQSSSSSSLLAFVRPLPQQGLYGAVRRNIRLQFYPRFYNNKCTLILYRYTRRRVAATKNRSLVCMQVFFARGHSAIAERLLAKPSQLNPPCPIDPRRHIEISWRRPRSPHTSAPPLENP